MSLESKADLRDEIEEQIYLKYKDADLESTISGLLAAIVKLWVGKEHERIAAIPKELMDADREAFPGDKSSYDAMLPFVLTERTLREALRATCKRFGEEAWIERTQK